MSNSNSLIWGGLPWKCIYAECSGMEYMNVKKIALSLEKLFVRPILKWNLYSNSRLMFTGDVFKQTKRNNRTTEFKQNKHLTLIKMVREGFKKN